MSRGLGSGGKRSAGVSPAGPGASRPFDAWKVEIKRADGEPGSSTIWVDKSTRKVVKQASVLPQMNGTTITSELAQ